MTTDTKLLFRQQRVRNVRAALKKTKAYLREFHRDHFPGRIVTSEYYSHIRREKELERDLRQYRAELSRYTMRIRRKKNQNIYC